VQHSHEQSAVFVLELLSDGGMLMRQNFEVKLMSKGPGGAWTYLPIPFDVQTVFGSKARVSVKGSINGFPFRNSLMPEGDGTHTMAVNKELQTGAKAKAGDLVRVILERDETERAVACRRNWRPRCALRH
jgi:hypothetical protein